MNILIVSTYEPMACGIGKYAEQQVAALRREGHRVDVLSPREGNGDFQKNLFGRFRPFNLIKYCWAYDETIIHYTPNFFYDVENTASRFKTSLAFLFLMLLAGRRVSFLIHETEFKPGRKDRGPLRHRLDRWYWRLARRVIFHSTVERNMFAWFYRLPHRRRQFEIWPHEQFMVRHCALDRAQARFKLGLNPNHTLLLCIGFIQPHKGFERAIAALQHVPAPNLTLRIVGSVRIAWDVAHAYAQTLHEMADRDPRCEVIESYLSDELFDTWMVAANYIVVPYHEIWTSGIAARAKLYGRPVIATRAGGLVEQLEAHSFIFSSDAELVEIFRQIAKTDRKEAENQAGAA